LQLHEEEEGKEEKEKGVVVTEVEVSQAFPMV